MASRKSPRNAREVVSPGEHLRQEIKRLGLNQTELSVAISVSRQMINYIIHRRRPISRQMASKLAKQMGRAPDYWLRNEYAAPPIPKPNTKLAKSSKVKPAVRKRRPWEWRSPKAQTFRAFLLKLSPVGMPDRNLLNAIKTDRGFPSVDTWADLRFHLSRLGASDEHFVAARALWRKYDARVKSK